MTRGIPPQKRTVVGIDVGGMRKGFHAVALTGGRYAVQCTTADVGELVAWCRKIDASVIAVDAPCRWSTDGRARPAERQLMKKGIWCFSTPTRQRAIEHPGNHYGWMLRGEALFQVLKSTHPLCSQPPAKGLKCCFETFPHAIAWHLTGGKAVAKKKRAQRRALLEEAGINLDELTNIDLVDAALCALTANHLADGRGCDHYGEPETGMIIVPDKRASSGVFGALPESTQR